MTSPPKNTAPETKSYRLFVLKNKVGMEIKITDFGARITSILATDRHGVLKDVLLGYSNLRTYEMDKYYLGATVGRYANRIARGHMTIEGGIFHLQTNNGVNHLHGGVVGFDKVLWTLKEKSGSRSIVLNYLSEDGEEGYPGNLDVEVHYELSDDNELIIKYFATTDKPTHINLTNHSYFNLSNSPEENITSHQLRINSKYYLPADAGNIPLGEAESVESTPFDFREMRVIGERINEDHLQLKQGAGYDHNWILEGGQNLDDIKAELYEPVSGRKLEVYTTEPGIQFYTGNYLSYGGTSNLFGQRSGLCLETQHFPNSPNETSYPDTLLEPGKKFSSTTIYKFSTQ